METTAEEKMFFTYFIITSWLFPPHPLYGDVSAKPIIPASMTESKAMNKRYLNLHDKNIDIPCSKEEVNLIEDVLSTSDSPFIKSCEKCDPELNSCIRDAFDHLRPYLSKGIPEINLYSIEPLRISKMTMDNGNGAVRVRAQFSNITVYGATNYTIIDVKGNVPLYKMELKLGIPRIEATGSYDVNGNVLLFPVRSQGDFWAMFSNITGVGKISGKEVIRNGTAYMKTERLSVDFKLYRSRFRIRDHLNGNNVIGEAMNQFLNQNAAEIIEEMKPAAAAALAKHFKAFLNGAFLQVPVPVWLKDTCGT